MVGFILLMISAKFLQGCRAVIHMPASESCSGKFHGNVTSSIRKYLSTYVFNVLPHLDVQSYQFIH